MVDQVLQPINIAIIQKQILEPEPEQLISTLITPNMMAEQVLQPINTATTQKQMLKLEPEQLISILIIPNMMMEQKVLQLTNIHITQRLTEEMKNKTMSIKMIIKINTKNILTVLIVTMIIEIQDMNKAKIITPIIMMAITATTSMIKIKMMLKPETIMT